MTRDPGADLARRVFTGNVLDGALKMDQEIRDIIAETRVDLTELRGLVEILGSTYRRNLNHVRADLAKSEAELQALIEQEVVK